ncbi:hypothetical protein [Parahalioglobus pacificus]|nr:hypothetical protein [Halioglobus pacificus]
MHAVPEFASELLSNEILARYLLATDGWLRREHSFDFDSGEYLRLVVDDFSKVERNAGLVRPCWLAANRVFPDLEQAMSQSEVNTFFFDRLFNDRVTETFSYVRALELPTRRVAVHVRGGDIIYGDTRLVANFGRLKSLSLPVAEAACRRYVEEGYGVIVFGATSNDLEYLASEIPNVISSRDLLPDGIAPATAMVGDVALMSDCELIVSSGDTAVTKLAELVGRAKLVVASDIYSTYAEHQALLEAKASPSFAEYSSLQRAFVCYCLYVTASAEETPQQLLSYVTEAAELDPQHTTYPILSYFCALACQDVEKASVVRLSFEQAQGKPLLDYLSAGYAKRRFIRFDEGPTPRLLREIVGRSDLTEDFKREASWLLAKYQEEKAELKCKTPVSAFKRRVMSLIKRIVRYFRISTQ